MSEPQESDCFEYNFCENNGKKICDQCNRNHQLADYGDYFTLKTLNKTNEMKHDERETSL